MQCAFFIVGPTATGKSDLAADLANELGAEIVSADAFQIYRGLDLLTAKPDATTLARAPHHLLGTLPLSEEMNAEKFRQLALRVIAEIESRDKLAIIVGGSGLYLKALTHGLTELPASDPKLRAELNEWSLEDLRARLLQLDPTAAKKIDLKNRRRVVRAIEICLLSGKPISRDQAVASAVRSGEDRRSLPELTDALGTAHSTAPGVFVFRDRDELYQRINRRVEAMFKLGVVEEVRAAGPTGETASQMIGLREIRQLLDGKLSTAQCIAAIQQATRRYAKRQLTWFRRQTNFPSLNLSPLTRQGARKWFSQKARLAAAHGND